MITNQMTKRLIYCWTSCSEELQALTIEQEISHQQNCCIRHQWHTYLKTSSLEYRILAQIMRAACTIFHTMHSPWVVFAKFAIPKLIYRELHSIYKISAMNHSMNSSSSGLVQRWICPAVDLFSGGQAKR